MNEISYLGMAAMIIMGILYILLEAFDGEGRD